MSIREQALKWWNSLTIQEKRSYANILQEGRTPQTLTGREIEFLFLSFNLIS